MPVFIWYMYIQLIGLKKCRILITVLTLSNRPSIVIKEGGPIMAQLFILSYSDAVSFRDIKGHLGTIPSIVTFIYAFVVEGDYSRVTVGFPGNKNRTILSSEETEKQVPVLSRCPC